jgi:hypothetical protein
VKNAVSEAEIRKFQQIAELFKKYGDQYDVDYLLMAAQGFQEFGLNQGVKSRGGASTRRSAWSPPAPGRPRRTDAGLVAVVRVKQDSMYWMYAGGNRFRLQGVTRRFILRASRGAGETGSTV